MQQIETGDDAVKWFVEAMTRHRLGRKRVLNRLLAATYPSAGIRSTLTQNVADFEVFGEFACLGPVVVATP